MFRFNIIVLFIIVNIFLITSFSYAFGIVNIKVNVIDESGSPIDNVKLSVRFSPGEKSSTIFTDEKGYCSLTSSSSDGVVIGTASKEGFYSSTFQNDFYVTKFGMWQPWGKKFTVVMRQVINPVPMYVRNTFFDFPGIDKKIGFDLQKSDWVIPYGQGTNSDFIFKVERTYDNRENFDAKMLLTFSNPLDGIQVIKDDGGGDFNVGSWFRLPRTAPETNYQPVLQKKFSRGTYGRHSDNKDDNNYIFRVRSEVDKNGKLIRAMYGKIRGEIQFAPLGSTKGKEGYGAVGMHYYLNSDYTRNLEFDPKRNLSIINSRSENVTQP